MVCPLCNLFFVILAQIYPGRNPFSFSFFCRPGAFCARISSLLFNLVQQVPSMATRYNNRQSLQIYRIENDTCSHLSNIASVCGFIWIVHFIVSACHFLHLSTFLFFVVFGTYVGWFNVNSFTFCCYIFVNTALFLSASHNNLRFTFHSFGHFPRFRKTNVVGYLNRFW